MRDEQMARSKDCVLALDLGTRCGWAYWAPPFVRPDSGVQVFDLARGESPGMRYVRFSRWLQELFDWDVWLVVYERPHLRGGYAAGLLTGLECLVQTHAAVREIEYYPVHSATLKKWAAGHGRAGKEQMIEAARRLWAIEPEDDNEADALCLLGYAKAEIVPQVQRGVVAGGAAK